MITVCVWQQVKSCTDVFS